MSRLISYAAEEAFSLGLATPLVIEQVSTALTGCLAEHFAGPADELCRTFVGVDTEVGREDQSRVSAVAMQASGNADPAQQ